MSEGHNVQSNPLPAGSGPLLKLKDGRFFSDRGWFLVVAGMTVLLGVIDWVTGYELQFFVFYFIPIAIAGWTCRSLRAYLIAILSATVWLMADLFSYHPYAHPIYAVWNTLIRLVAFWVLALAVSRIRFLLAKERDLTRDLQKTLSEVKTLTGLLPICASCKRIRNDQGYWQQLESYLSMHMEARFTHGICQECADKLLQESGLPPMPAEPVSRGDPAAQADTHRNVSRET
jgi:hypothetical protein